jgi:hypothetical protein
MDKWTFSFGKYKDQEFQTVFEDKKYTEWVHKVVDESPPEKQNKCFLSYVKYCKKKNEKQ